MNGLKIGLSVVVLIMAVAMAVSSVKNQSLQDKVTTEHQMLAKAQTFATIDNSLIQFLAKVATDKNDAAIRNLLASNGVTFKVEGAPASSPAPAPAAPGASQ